MKRAIIICFNTKSKNISLKKIYSLVDYLKLFSNNSSKFFICISFNDKENDCKDRFNISLEDLLIQLKSDNYQIINIISLFIFPNDEFKKIIKIIQKFKNSFLELTLSDPIITLEQDYFELAQNIINLTNFPNSDNFNFLILTNENSENYPWTLKLQKSFKNLNKNNYFVKSISDISTNDDLISNLNLKKEEKLLVLPLQLFSDELEEKKIKSTLNSILNDFRERELNIELIPIGLGEIKSIQDILINRLIRSYGI